MYISGVTDKDYVYNRLHIPSLSYRLSEVFPPGAVLVLDHLESVPLTGSLRAFLLEVALDSRKFRNYVVVVCLSNVEAADAILKLNGNSKIHPLCRADSFRWSKEMVEEYVAQLVQWSECDKVELVRLAH